LAGGTYLYGRQMDEVDEFETTYLALRGEMTVTIMLTDADGGTDVLAVHEGLPPGLSPADNEEGGRMALAKLATLVEAKKEIEFDAKEKSNEHTKHMENAKELSGVDTMNLSAEERSRTVISSRIIEAPVGDVFDAYANPKKIVRWWGPGGFTLTNDLIDLQEGGHWRFVFKGQDGTEYKNHLVFLKIERPHLFVVDHLSGPKYRGTVTFDDMGNRTRVTMYWTFENTEVFAKIKDVVTAGNEGNFDRLSDLVAELR